MKVVGIIVAVLVLIGGCCIGALFLGSYAMNEGLRTAIQPQVEGTPPIEKYIGKIDSMSISWSQTAQQAQSGDQNRLALDVSGDKGTALMIVKMNEDGGPDALKWAVLEVDGANYRVMGTPPEDVKPVNLDGTPAESASEDADAADGTKAEDAVGAAGADGADGAAGAAGAAEGG